MRAGIEQLRAEPRLRGLTGAKTEDNSMKREDINIRDPFILTDRENGVYYLYGTRGDARRKELGYGFDVFVSRDLEEFSEPTVVFSPSDGFWGKYDFWAPEVHFYKGKYYMFASFKADGKCRATHILRSDSPMGPFVPVSDTPATPAGQECLDGTLYVEDGIPYIVYSHEWLQVKDGEMCARRLSDDLTEAVGEPILLFRASGPSWAKAINDDGAYVTDGPFLYRTESGRLLMLWASFSKDGYAEAIAYSDNGKIDGKWSHDDRLLFSRDGDPHEEYTSDGFNTLVDRVVAARKNGRPVIFSMGAHVIKNRLSRYLIAMIKEGIITHIATNGAGSIHDFELAYLGGTSEDVPTAIEDGSFGMWEQTGRWMNEALKLGSMDGLGYGESLGRYVDTHKELFPYRDDCVFYNAYLADIPATYHIALGTDIIHQHPTCDMSVIGKCSGIDFKKMCASVAELDGGVFLNFGSAVIGAEVFLKALSIARNLGYPTFNITTANFDLINLGDYRRKIGYSDPNYYYRPRKNIVNRPTSQGGLGWHFCGDHQITIPTLYDNVSAKIKEEK